MKWLYERMDSAFSIVDKRLSKSLFLVGDNLTIAHISLSGYLFYPENESAYPVEAKYKNIARWLQKIREIPGWSPPYDIFPNH